MSKMHTGGVGANDRGAAAVEFASVMLLLMLLVFGIIQFGYTFFQYLEVVHAAREGVRWAALGDDPTSVRNKIRDAAPGLTPALTDGQITIDVGASGREQAVFPGDMEQPVSVTVRYASPVLVPLVVDHATIPLESTAVMRGGG